MVVVFLLINTHRLFHLCLLPILTGRCQSPGEDTRAVIKEALRFIKKGGLFVFQYHFLWKRIYGETEELLAENIFLVLLYLISAEINTDT